MNAKHLIQRRTTRLSQKPVRHPEQREDPELTSSQKLAIGQALIDGIYLPVLNGTALLREVITPAGGWEQMEARFPGLNDLPVEKQLAFAFCLT
jgi:hypothetical protein